MTDSGGLSQEDFVRLQDELIQLKNNNYELRAELEKKKMEIQQQSNTKSEALQFANKLMGRTSKKDERDGEIDSLRRKLETQEEEFKLQQQTLFEEMNSLSAKNEELKQQINQYSVHPLEKESGSLMINDENTCKEQLKTLEQELSIVNTQTIPELKEKNDQLSERLDSNMLVIDDLTKEKNGYYKQLSDTKIMYEMEIQKNKMLDKLIKDLSHSNDLYHAKEKEGENKYIDQLREYMILEKQHNETIALVEQKDSEIKEIQNECRTLHQRMALFEEDLSRLETEKENLEEQMREDRNVYEFEQKNTEKLLNESIQETKILERQLKECFEVRKQNDEMINSLREQAKTAFEKFSEEKDLLIDDLKKQNEKITELRDEARETCDKFLEEKEQLIEKRFELEIIDIKNSLEAEIMNAKGRIEELESQLRAADDDKKLAVKKESALVKELKKALKEERKRADSYERKSEERGGWHMVDGEEHATQAYDANESISSLSAIETENFELITRLTTLQRVNSENADKIMRLEAENSRLNREVVEKGELIENLIREKPMGFGNTSNTTTPRFEAGFRKLLNNIGQDSPVNHDVKEMNKKLQRMLEETLSKNIRLQRDVQTLMERSGL